LAWADDFAFAHWELVAVCAMETFRIFQAPDETCAASQRPLHIHRQGIAQKDPAGTLDARQGIQSAARRSSEVLQCCGHSLETEDLRHCGYTATLFDVFCRDLSSKEWMSE